MTFNSILEKYRKFSFSKEDLGRRFERLMKAYLMTDPKYATLFQNVWLWSDFFAKKDFGGHDTGIDLVAFTYNGDFWAIQCKCFQDDSYIDKPAVDTFLSTSSRKFLNETFQTVTFAHRLWISTTNKWTSNAEESIKNQHPPVSRINLYDLQYAPVDWEKLEEGIHGLVAQTEKKSLRPHQTKAVTDTHSYFNTHDRGKLIMACGTGKTFTSLRIAESETGSKGLVLFLVPSIALLGQILNEWYADAINTIDAVCICSDPAVSKKQSKNQDSNSISVVDLALPASTDVKNIVNQFFEIEKKHHSGKTAMTVVFSTYQSIEVISKAQKILVEKLPQYSEFDLIICDEAHRTTGVTLSGDDESAFVKVHDNNFIRSKKRLYMTATPRLYSDEVISKAKEADATLCSMDDKEMYGDEIYRIGFGQAVDEGLLTDYKVLILTLNQNDIPPAVQDMISDKNNEINTDDISKLIGCINALSKQVIGDNGSIKATDPEPMRRAVAFCQTIIASKNITTTFNNAAETYISQLPLQKRLSIQSVSSKHIDGTMSATSRNDLMSWLKEEPDERECRVLTNVRCLSEGVDVPSLDAVMFLSARNSQIDVVQSVGRVMRKAEGKKYGYIIIPVVVPATIEAEKALDDNERYKVVWTVLNALRAHDDRFNATINKTELNRKKPENILVGRPDISFDENGNPVSLKDEPGNVEASKQISQQLLFQFEQLQNVVFARMVQKVGDKRYWEQWAKSVGEIAENQNERIGRMIKSGNYKTAFEKFLSGLQKNINPGISTSDAIEMLSQHIITKPVFEALFEGYSFVKNNPISVSMQSMLDLLEESAIEKDTEVLQKFYESVKMRASGIDNAEGKQRIITELYDKFFKTAFPKMVQRLGIVYTPVEVVDFIIHSVNDVLIQEFGRTVSDENVNILDPFTGTGTFITRLIQSGLIHKNDLERKYHHELFANEIVLLAYYIAAVNIENVFHDAITIPAVEKSNNGNPAVVRHPSPYTLAETSSTVNEPAMPYKPFDGICLTDTFQLSEYDEKIKGEGFSPENSERIDKQKTTPITVIIGNPPYSIGQRSANDNAQNQSYPKLDSKISITYAKQSSAGLNKSLYDAYIKAFRWSADRLGNNNGIIAFVSNGAWLDGNSTDGFRKTLEKEFSKIYVFNLRGNQRTSGELSRREGGKIFGSGSRTPIAITVLVKNKTQQPAKAKIHYFDIGDYFSREEKLSIVKKNHSLANMQWQPLAPNKHGDWLNQRNDVFASLIPLEPTKKFDLKTKSFFNLIAIGIATNRDAWVLNFSNQELSRNMQRMIEFYNQQSTAFIDAKNISPDLEIENFIDTTPSKISWTVNLKKNVETGKIHRFYENSIQISLYRPFTKEFLYYDKPFIERPGLWSQLFPTKEHENLIICITGMGVNKDFSVLITDVVPDLQLQANGQCYPLYYYEENNTQQLHLFDNTTQNQYIRRDTVSNFIFERAKQQYGKKVTKEDIFYYVYGFLHSPYYRQTFASDLKKMLPRLPLVDDVRHFRAFSKVGRALAYLHLNYESIPHYPGIIEKYHPLSISDTLKHVSEENSQYYDFKVEKMSFPSKNDKSKIIYNSQITIEEIPLEAYEYIVNGKSAIEWIMERYQITTHKESGITNNPNDWSTESGNPRYIIDLLHSIINLSVQTVAIVKNLPDITALFNSNQTQDQD